MKRKVWSILLALSLALTLLPTAALAEESLEAPVSQEEESTIPQTPAEGPASPKETMPGETMPETGAARIGENTYATFALALAAAVEGDTLTLLEDTDTGVFVDIGKTCATDVTFDLNGYTLSFAPAGGSTGTETN